MFALNNVSNSSEQLTLNCHIYIILRTYRQSFKRSNSGKARLNTTVVFGDLCALHCDQVSVGI